MSFSPLWLHFRSLVSSNVIMMLFAEDDDSAQSVEIVRLNEIEKEDGSITRSVLFRTDSMAGILVSDFSSDGMIDGLDAYLWGADSAMALIFDFNIDPFVIPQ